MSKTYIFLTDDGRLIPFNPSDFEFRPHVKDLEAGMYEPRLELVKIEGNTAKYQVVQLFPPLVKVR